MLSGDYLNKVAAICGIKPDDPTLVKLQSIKELSTAEVPDAWATSLEGLMTVEAARNNPQLRDHYYATYNNGVDAKVDQVMELLGLDETDATEIRSEKKSVQRIEKLALKIKEAEGKKSSAKPGDKKEWEDKITELNAQVKGEKDKLVQEIAKVNGTWHERLKKVEMEKVYADFNYGVDLPKDVLIQTTDSLVQKKLAEKKYKAVYDPEKNSISLRTEADLEAFENNTPVNFKDFATSVVSENKLLKTNGTAPAVQPPQGHYTAPANKGAMDTSLMDAAFANIQLAQ